MLKAKSQRHPPRRNSTRPTRRPSPRRTYGTCNNPNNELCEQCQAKGLKFWSGDSVLNCCFYQTEHCPLTVNLHTFIKEKLYEQGKRTVDYSTNDVAGSETNGYNDCNEGTCPNTDCPTGEQ